MATQEPVLNTELGIDGRYRFQSVCLLTETEFNALLRYAETYIAKTKSDGKNEKYGTFEITLGPSQAAKSSVYARTKSLAFLTGAAQVLQKQAAGPDKSEALNRLELTVRRLNAAK